MQRSPAEPKPALTTASAAMSISLTAVASASAVAAVSAASAASVESFSRLPIDHGVGIVATRGGTCTVNPAAVNGAAKLFSGASIRWVDCQPATCQRVYFANHTSHLDALVLWSCFPKELRQVTRAVAANAVSTCGRPALMPVGRSAA